MGGRLWHWVKTSAPALAAYWALTFYGLFVFSGVILVLDPGAAGEIMLILAQLWAVTVVGQVAGHVLGYLRPRLWVVWIIVGVTCGAWFAVSPGLLAVPWVVVAWFFLPFALGSGFLAIRHGTEVFGTFMPVVYSIGACIVLLNRDAEKLAAWKGGEKYAVWDAVNIAILAGCLLIFIIYMVARQSQSLTHWQEGAQAPLRAGVPVAYKPRARVSWLTWVLVAGLAFVVTVGTALLSPFLFRTGEQEGDGGGGGQQQQPSDGDGGGREPGDGEPYDGEPQDGKDKIKPPDADWDKVGEGIKKAAQAGFDLLTFLLMILVGLLLIYFVFWRPARRVALLRHLERPAWPVPTTERIHDLWRRALIALRDLDIETKDSETVEDVARRATQELAKRHGQPPTGLVEAAEIYSRVNYDLGVNPEDTAKMAASVELFTDYTEGNSPWWKQLRNLYRGTST